MNYKLVLSDNVKKQFKKMDKYIALLILKEMQKTLNNVENPRYTGKALTGDKKGLWRYRIGNYRVICDIKDTELIILALEVGHRKLIYQP